MSLRETFLVASPAFIFHYAVDKSSEKDQILASVRGHNNVYQIYPRIASNKSNLSLFLN